jgi:cell division protein FtsN
MFSPELDERVVLPQQRRKTVGEIEAEKNTVEENKLTEEKITEVQHAVTNNNTQTSKPQAPVVRTEVVNARVVVGYYATEKQAEVAKSIIQDAGLNVVPIVKNMGGYYTLQVGSYSSREKAQQAANSLLKSNFPARVILD